MRREWNWTELLVECVCICERCPCLFRKTRGARALLAIPHVENKTRGAKKEKESTHRARREMNNLTHYNTALYVSLISSGAKSK